MEKKYAAAADTDENLSLVTFNPDKQYTALSKPFPAK